jgi:hypothetical protein
MCLVGMQGNVTVVVAQFYVLKSVESISDLDQILVSLPSMHQKSCTQTGQGMQSSTRALCCCLACIKNHIPRQGSVYSSSAEHCAASTSV